MRKHLILFVLALACPALASDGNDSSLEAMRLARAAGVPGLALHFLNESPLPRADKEAQRIMLLTESGRHEDALQAAHAYPVSGPEWALRQAWLSGARSALALGNSKAALGLAARLLWQSELAPDVYREARLLVIEAILASGRGQDAYRAMLRYQQEFHPLGRAQVVRFTEGLISAGLDAEAVTWLADLEMGSPLRLLARLKAGLLTPADAMAEVRRVLDPPPPPPAKGKKLGKSAKTVSPAVLPRPENEMPYWAILAHAGLLAEEPAVVAEAMEKLLDGRTLAPGIWGGKPAALWQAYGAIARQEANAAQLLDGDDRAWFNQALALASSRALAARAMFGHLAVAAKDIAVRETAQANWLQLMLARRLDRTAIRLLSEHQGKQESGLPLATDAVMRALPVDDLPRRREVWFMAGEEALTRGFHAQASTAFLRAAEGNDVLAQEARWRAAESLARAGLGQDAVALLKAKNP